MNTTLKAVISSAILGFGFSQTATAASVSNTFDVKLHVNASCKFNTAAITAINFGDREVNSSQTPVNQQTEFRVQCTKGTTPVVKMVSANNWSMKGMAPNNNDKLIAYKLYSDAARAVEWNATKGPSVNNLGTENIFTVYGQVSSIGDTAGDYVDTVTVSLDF